MSEFISIRQYRFLKFDPKLLYLGVVPTNFKNESKPIGYKKVLEQWGSLNIQAALNGPMAGWSKSKTVKQNYDLATSMFLESAYYQKSIGLNFPVSKVGIRGGITIGTKLSEDHFLIPFSTLGYPTIDESIQTAIQLPITMVHNHKKANGLNSGNLKEKNHRPAIGITQDGHMILGGGYGSCEELAQALIDAGCIEAGYTDGGGSYHFMVQNKLYGPVKDRPTPSWILVLSENEIQKLLKENY